MSREVHTQIADEDLELMIEKDVAASKSIYPPSGDPDPRLTYLFKDVSSELRTVDSVSSGRVKIEVTILLDIEQLVGTDPLIRERIKTVLLHDGQRRLASHNIDVDESSYHEQPDRLVYLCAKSHKSQISKFIELWHKA